MIDTKHKLTSPKQVISEVMYCNMFMVSFLFAIWLMKNNHDHITKHYATNHLFLSSHFVFMPNNILFAELNTSFSGTFPILLLLIISCFITSSYILLYTF